MRGSEMPGIVLRAGDDWWLVTEYSPEPGQIVCRSMTRPEEPVHRVDVYAIDRTWHEVKLTRFPECSEVWATHMPRLPLPPRNVMQAVRDDWARRSGPLPPEAIPMDKLYAAAKARSAP